MVIIIGAVATGNTITLADENSCHFSLQNKTTRSQDVARIADRTASQHLWGSRDVIGHVTI